MFRHFTMKCIFAQSKSENSRQCGDGHIATRQGQVALTSRDPGLQRAVGAPRAFSCFVTIFCAVEEYFSRNTPHCKISRHYHANDNVRITQTKLLLAFICWSDSNALVNILFLSRNCLFCVEHGRIKRIDAEPISSRERSLTEQEWQLKRYGRSIISSGQT